MVLWDLGGWHFLRERGPSSDPSLNPASAPGLILAGLQPAPCMGWASRFFFLPWYLGMGARVGVRGMESLERRQLGVTEGYEVWKLSAVCLEPSVFLGLCNCGSLYETLGLVCTPRTFRV